MHSIHLHDTTYQIPSRWDELSADQLRRIAWLSTLKKDSSSLSKLFFFVLTSSLPLWKRLRLQYFYLIQASTDERGDFLELVESFQQFRAFTKQIQEKIWCKTVLLYGPASGLANCTFFEYIQAEQYFLNYLQADSKRQVIKDIHLGKESARSDGKADEWLDRLVATLYRQKRRGYDPAQDDDPRIPLNAVGTRYRLRYTRKLDRYRKIGVLMWFDGCRQHLIKRFPLIFQQAKSQQVGKWNAQAKKQGSAAEGWLSLISELSGGMNNYDAIGNTNLYTALTDVSFRIKKNQEAERARSKASRKK